MMTFHPAGRATAIGSLPHLNPQDAVASLLARLPEIPAWPQLPNTHYLESMYAQFSGGMPFVHLEPEQQRIYMNLSGDIYVDLERFYPHVLNEDLDYFAISADYASGLKAFLDNLWRSKPPELDWIKGQITGPISFGLMITDQRKRSVLYHEEAFDAVLKSLALKARWQVRYLRRLHPRVLIFIDEPYLSSFGSAFINLSREQVINYLSEIIAAIHQAGALAGVHCCGNTDWSILMDTEIDIINFDAVEYFQGLTLYLDPLKEFLQKGGVLAWGLIPTSSLSAEDTVESLFIRFREKLHQLTDRGIKKDLLLQQSLLTPSCGMGSLKMSTSERVLHLLTEVSNQVRSQLVAKPHRKASSL